MQLSALCLFLPNSLALALPAAGLSCRGASGREGRKQPRSCKRILVVDSSGGRRPDFSILFWYGLSLVMPPVEERPELGGYHGAATPGYTPWSYKPGHAYGRQLLVEEGTLLFSPLSQQQDEEDEESLKPFKSVISNIDHFVDGSVSSLLEHCLGWSGRHQESANSAKAEQPSSPPLLPPLHAACAAAVPSVLRIRRLLRQGCDPNQNTSFSRGSSGTALHMLLAADHPVGVPLTAIVRLLLAAGASLTLTDSAGNTALTCLQHLLRQERMQEAVDIAALILNSNNSCCDVNWVNGEGRSLLSYSVSYLDASAELTRLLVNHGGRVWPHPAPAAPLSVEAITADREESAFTWFLRTIISLPDPLGRAEATLACLCHEMGRDPGRMKTHVLRALLSEGRHPRVLGPLYLQLKLTMAPFWSEPQQLRYLAWKSVRRSLGPKRLYAGSRQLGLPSPMRRYLTLAPGRNSSSGSSCGHLSPATMEEENGQ